MTPDVINGVLLFLALFSPLIGVFIFSITDRFVDTKRKIMYIVLVLLVISLIFQNYTEYYLMEYVININARTFISVYGYTIRPIIIAFYIYLVSPKKKHIPVQILCFINLLIYTTAFYSKICISISSDNHFMGGPLRYTCLITSAILLLYHIIIVIFEFRKNKKSILLIPMLLTLAIVLGIILDIYSYYPVTHRVDYITIMIVTTTIFYYIWLHIQFVYRHESDLLAQQKIQIALSQIKPHFIYNTLNAIQDIDGMPKKAQDAIVDFSKYLRENLDFLTSSNLIPFSKELEHVNKYVNLEKLRFEEKINVNFDIKTKDFLIPSLSLQMIVENAIKHGITKKYEGGYVNISTFEKDNKIFIIVEDNGVGFQFDKVIGENHLGFKNSKERLKYFVNGDLIIESEVNKGTRVTMIIPKPKGDIDENYNSWWWKTCN